MPHMTTIKQSKKLLQKVIEQGDTRMAGFLHSSPGIGKSAIIKQIAEALGLPLIDIRLASIEATDLCGIPYVRNGEQVFSTPEWFPTDPNSKGILFLDELSNANINVQQAAYRLVLDREINNNKTLPAGWFTIAAGNLQTDRTGVKGIVPALANRFSIHLNIEPNLQDFMTYGIDHGIDTRILGFLDFKPDYLHKFTSGTDQAFPTPRSWEFASNLLKCSFSDGEVLTALSGCIGEGPASEFQAFCKYYENLPNFTKLMDGGVEYTLPKGDLGLMSALTSSLISLFKENHSSEKKMTNLSKVMRQLPDESLILIYKLISGTDDGVMIMNVTEYTLECYERVEKYFD